MNQQSSNKIDGKIVQLTNLDKIFWPKEKFTKGDVIDYYQKIAPFILPYLKNRPESLNRHPNGIAGKNFFQKDVDHIPPKWAKVIKIHSDSAEKDINYLVCQDKATLVYMANLGCIEINPWNSRLGKLHHPDFMIIDLDPEKISFERVVEVALTVHKLFDQLKIPNYCKTSGATGLHIYVPMGAKYTYDQVRHLAHQIAILVNQKLPSITSLERHPSKRQGKVYLDYLQNNKGQTLAAPYSIRPKPGATVSTPVEWKEVKIGLSPQDFNIKNIFARLKKKGDLWKPVLGRGIDLKKALKQIEIK